MADDQQKNINNDFTDSSDNASFSPKENPNNTTGEEEQPESCSQGNRKDNCQTHPNVVVNIPANNDAGFLEAARKDNKYNRIGLFISTILALFTLVALGLTLRTINITKEDLKETKRQFEIANKPFLQCKDFAVMVFEPNKRPKIAYQIVNFGEYTATVINRTFRIECRDTIPVDILDRLTTANTDTFAAYVNKENPIIEAHTEVYDLPEIVFNEVKAGRLNIVFSGEIIYKREDKGDTIRHIFCAIVQPLPAKEYRLVTNKTVHIRTP